MAGSYLHCVDDRGRLRGFEQIAASLETGGDVFEAVEEMYGMIWWLANRGSSGPATTRERVERARKAYRLGLEIAEELIT